MKKLHIGTGCIYLLPDDTGEWINLDVWGSGAALAKDCPAGVEKWGTTWDDYYGKLKHIDEAYLGKDIADHETLVCDMYGSWTNIPLEDESVDLIASVQCFEHLSKTESRYALMEARRVMKTGANLRLAVPDHEQTLREYAHILHEASILPLELEAERKARLNSKAAFMLRHLLGSRKNDWAYHMGSWTKPKLIEFCKQYGFRFVCEEENFNFYPSIHLRFEKFTQCGIPELDDPIHPWKAAWEYCGENGALEVPEEWRCLEVGPGTAPWPRANQYCDVVERDMDNFAVADVQKLPYATCGFDFVYAAHVLEHVEDPIKAASELSRVAKSGCVVCPSPFKEGLFAFHEQDHKWSVFKSGDTLYFKRIPDGLYPALYDADVSAEMHRLWRYGDRRLEGLANKLKRWMHSAEPKLDCIHHWRDSLKVVVLE